WVWLEGFGDVGKEYAAIRDDVAVWDVSPLNKWDLRGSDALQAAQGVFTNDALCLDVGHARHRAFVDAAARVGAHREGPRRLFGRGAARPRRRVRMDRAADATSRRDRTAVARGRADAHRC